MIVHSDPVWQDNYIMLLRRKHGNTIQNRETRNLKLLYADSASYKFTMGILRNFGESLGYISYELHKMLVTSPRITKNDSYIQLS